MLGGGNLADVLADEFVKSGSRQDGGESLGHVDRALRSDRLDTGCAADVRADEVAPLQHRIAQMKDRPQVTAEPQGHVLRQSVLGGYEARHFILQVSGTLRGGLDVFGHDVQSIAPGIAKQNPATVAVEHAGEAAEHLAREDRQLRFAQRAESFHITKQHRAYRAAALCGCFLRGTLARRSLFYW